MGSRASVAGAALLATLACGCGAGTGGIAGLLSRGRGSPPQPAAGDVRVLGSARTSPLSFSFRLVDAAARPADVAVTCRVGTGAPMPIQLTGDTGLAGLGTSAGGTVHVRAWDFATQLLGAGLRRDVTITVAITGTSAQASSAAFDVGNDPPAVQVVSAPGTEVAGPVPVDLVVLDSSADAVGVQVEYRRLDDVSGWRAASALGDDLASVATSAAGRQVRYLWDVQRDEPGREFPAQLRFVPSDGTHVGAPAVTGTLAIDNNEAPVAIVDGSAFLATPDARRGIPVPFQLVDAEGDAARIAFQWRTALGSFPALPSAPAQLAAILADPAARRQYQIATPWPVVETGVLAPVDATRARLPELAARASTIAGDFMVGRELRVLRPAREPAAIAPTWPANPLQHPVAAAAIGTGEVLLVLDRPQAGAWRLHEVRLADGQQVRVVAGGNDGTPSALAAVPGEASVLVATGVAGLWRLRRVELATGTVHAWHVAGGSVTGTVGGLAMPAATVAALTVGSSLLVVDRRTPANPLERVVLAGLATPAGVAADPANPRRVYLAERDWVDPSNSNPDGRLLAVDWEAGLANRIAVGGTIVRRPTSVAVDDSAANLWFVSDEATGDATLELRSARLNGGSGGPGHVLSRALPPSAAGIATGPAGLVAVCDTAGHGLWVGGGIVQARAIAAWAPATTEATAAGAFVPAPAAGDGWQVADDATVLPLGAASRRDTFVWDSRDAPPGEAVVLRAVPFDTDVGLATETGVPKTVRAGIDVLPALLGSAATNAGVSGLAIGDFNGDGLPDLVSANRGTDRLSVFFQTGPGVFSATPSLTVAGLLTSPLRGPAAVALVDADGDGDLDVVSANRTSGDGAVVQQLGPGTLVTSAVPLATGGQPWDVAAGDLDGDGRADVVFANRATNRLQVFFRQALGMFPLNPSVTLTDPNATAPVAVVAADLDGDGDLDLASCNETSQTVTVFRQTAAGVFAQPASQVLSGAGVVDGPADLVVRDFDGDGRPDLAVANRTGNCVAVFLQTAGGVFPPAPTQVLASPAGPALPRQVAAADVDGDGVADLIACDAANNLLVFAFDAAAGAFRARPLVAGAGGALSGPAALLASDLSGDARTDLVVANETAGNVAVLVQVTPGDFRDRVPDVVLGGSATTPAAAGATFVDADQDGDLDLVCANAGNGTLSVFHQLAPAVFASDPGLVLGGGPEVAGVASVVAADLDGDGRADLATANPGAGTLAVFLRGAGGGFAATPARVLGSGTLSQPVAVVAADLDQDGDVDLACADRQANRVLLFRQVAPGVFETAPWLVLGSAATTTGAAALACADWDLDGTMDVACTAEGSGRIAVFLQAAGTFPADPDRVLGTGATTALARGLAFGHWNGDALLDLACASGSGNSIAVFFATGPGTWPVAPSLVLTGAPMQDPTTVAGADLNGDGWPELVAANRGTDRLAVFVQTGNGVFPFAPAGFGGPGRTDAAAQLLLADVDRDGDPDVASVQPGLATVALFFNSH